MTAKNDVPSVAQERLREAQAALAAGDHQHAAAALRHALAVAPQFTAARQHYATVLLHHLADPAAALEQIDRLLAAEPGNTAYLTFRAAAASRIGDHERALADYAVVTEAMPRDHGAWLRYGHALKTAGRTPDAIAAYRRSLSLAPSGESWWSLADLKTTRFSSEDVAAMRRLAQHGALPVSEQAALHFALGKALDDASDAAGAFVHYDLGNTLKRSIHNYRPGEMTAFVDRALELLTPEFFASRTGTGCQRRDPVFVVGLPRSGSTLVEQILASHSQIEGTMELPDMIAVAREALTTADDKVYPNALAKLAREDFLALGERYIARTHVYRRRSTPFFIDKMPDNFIHTGLIHLILPNARIVDVRRHPLACGLSVFRQNFAAGQTFSYGLADIGHYYADYVRLMAHMDSVLPGRVHRVAYEQLVADPEGVTRRLLDHIGVPFEPTCLRFYDNPRAVRTASAEQVRRPIFADGLDSWKRYDPWLGPLKVALGETLEA